MLGGQGSQCGITQHYAALHIFHLEWPQGVGNTSILLLQWTGAFRRMHCGSRRGQTMQRGRCESSHWLYKKRQFSCCERGITP